MHTLAGHHGEISSTGFNFSGDMVVSGSIDRCAAAEAQAALPERALHAYCSLHRTCKLWDVGSGECIQTLKGHNDEILDVTLNANGEWISCSEPSARGSEQRRRAARLLQARASRLRLRTGPRACTPWLREPAPPSS